MTDRNDELNERNPCGESGFDDCCACGCGGDDSRCAYYLWVYSFTEEQVRPEHICCSIPGRG